MAYRRWKQAGGTKREILRTPSARLAFPAVISECFWKTSLWSRWNPIYFRQSVSSTGTPINGEGGGLLNCGRELSLRGDEEETRLGRVEGQVQASVALLEPVNVLLEVSTVRLEVPHPQQLPMKAVITKHGQI